MVQDIHQYREAYNHDQRHILSVSIVHIRNRIKCNRSTIFFGHTKIRSELLGSKLLFMAFLHTKTRSQAHSEGFEISDGM
jgi:hypothetical protein